MKFRHVAAGYALVWCALIIVMCVWEWFGLKSFQNAYDVEKSREKLLDSMKQEAAKLSGAQDQKGTGNKNETPKEMRVVLDNTMKVFINGEPYAYSIREPGEDLIYEELSERTGKNYQKGTCVLPLGEFDVLRVEDSLGNEILPSDGDYTAGTYVFEESMTTAAVRGLEVYLKYINGLASSEDLKTVMRSDSKIYRALMKSQDSLQWMIKSKSMEFTKEEICNVAIFDAEHFACDLVITITKVPDTERERIVEETVNYRVLMEKSNGNWFLYAFVTK